MTSKTLICKISPVCESDQCQTLTALPGPPAPFPPSPPPPRSPVPALTGAHGEHLLEVGGDRHLLVELRRLGQEGAVLEVRDREHVGTALRSRRDDLRRVDLHESLSRRSHGGHGEGHIERYPMTHDKTEKKQKTIKSLKSFHPHNRLPNRPDRSHDGCVTI